MFLLLDGAAACVVIVHTLALHTMYVTFNVILTHKPVPTSLR